MLNSKNYITGDQNVQVPAHLNFGQYMLDRLRCMGDEVAIENAENGEKITYKAVVQHAVKVSVALTKIGVGKGDVVILGSENTLQFIPTALGVIFTGATYTSYDYDGGKGFFQHKTKLARPKYAICTEFFYKYKRDLLSSFGTEIILFIRLEELVASAGNIDVDSFEPASVKGQVDTAMIFFSSGTTGMPKGSKLSHLNCILISMNSYEPFFDEQFSKTVYVRCDRFHGYGTFTTFRFLALGKKVIFTTTSSAETLLAAFEKQQVNAAFLVPLSITQLAETEIYKDFNLQNLKYVFSGGSSLPVKTMKKFQDRFPSIKYILQSYGSTECGYIASENCNVKKMGSVGCIYPAISVKVVEPETQKILGPNKTGEILLKGPAFMIGYIEVDTSTYLDEEGWFKTRDLGYYDEEKYLYVVGRIKNIIIYNGFKVSPEELETILLSHPDVREAGVVGKPVPVYGQEPTAFVIRHPGSNITEQELVDFVAAEVTDYMQLRGGVKFVSELPKNPIGKILHRRLVEMLNEA